MADLQVSSTDQNEGVAMADFEALLDSYDYDRPQSGEILKGIILEANDDEVILDIGAKHDAFVSRRDLDSLEQDLLDQLVPGAEINVYVLRKRGGDGEMRVSINKALTLEDWEKAEELMEADTTIEVSINGYNKGGVLVDFGRLRGFVPNSQILRVPRGAPRDQQDAIKDTMVGQMLSVKIIEVNRRRNRLVLSEAAAMRDQREELLKALEIGSVVKGRVVKIVEYGAFIDLGGINGLAHISKLAWHHVNHPSEELTVGEEIEVRIEDVDVERERISLNRQALLPDPWELLPETYSVGDMLTGVISSVVDYGIFVELPNGITGLVHVSEMASYNVTDPKSWAREGEELLVRIISIDTDRKRIGLSLDQVPQNALYDWMTARGEEPNGGEPEAATEVTAEAEAEAEVAEEPVEANVTEEVAEPELAVEEA